ncbi:MAG TPA: aminotransferase class I/II-fold pyridoxal phosphate-dependent enzyme [Thermoplasmata archaeon]|nr:aminotransferase class I/II-fold pyridoxal phosphate-dependent enzyme [Thermoplasmata archaeon]
MHFPLRDWLQAHADCRHDLGESGMHGSIAPPPWPRRAPDPDVAEVLADELGRHLGVARERLFLARGASEANGWVLGHLARASRARRPGLRVQYPEYPPLFDAAAALGFRPSDGRGAAEAAAISQPRNPEGDLWGRARLESWAEDVRAVLIDETFREFAGTASLARAGTPGWWTTGSFTKFFGADDVRVGFAVAPPEAVEAFRRYVGLVADDLAPASAAMALALLRRRDAVARQVRAVIAPAVHALSELLPHLGRPQGPVAFDRVPGEDGDRLARRCLDASVRVAPGSLFGDPSGVRLCLTRRDAARSLRAYAAVRERGSPRSLRGRSRV